jgi:hypothetical protein
MGPPDEAPMHFSLGSRFLRLQSLPYWLIALALLTGCSASPKGGSIRTTHGAPFQESFTVVRNSLESMGYSVTKEDQVTGEIQAASAPYGIAPLQCQGNELRLLSKPKENCEIHAKKLAETISTSVPVILNLVASPSTPTQFTITKSETLVDEGIQSLVSQLAIGIKEHRVMRIAVFPIADVSRPVLSPLSTYLSEKITDSLYGTKVATVVERTRLVRIMDELALTASPRFDDKSIKNVGKLAGVDALVLGVYSTVGSRTIEINVRLVSVETAELLGIGSARIPMTAIQDLLR